MILLSDSLRLMMPQWIAESVVEIEGDNGLWELVEIASQDVGSIMDSIASPIETLTIALRRVESSLQLFDTTLCTC